MELHMTTRFSRACRGALVVLSLATAGLAQAANDYFLKIDGIAGSSTDKSHKDWIDIDSFAWGLTLTTAGGNSGVGKASFADFAWSQSVDISTPKWMLQVATGKHVPTVTLDVVKVGGKASDLFFQMIFTGTLGTKMTINAGGDTLYEAAAMTSGETVKLRYRPQDDKGGFGPWVEGSFNIKENSSKALFSGNEAVLMGLFSAGGNIAFDAGAITPVPEPANAALLLGGLAALVAFRRGRRA
jgi:type VI protein secretion system component Hcp